MYSRESSYDNTRLETIQNSSIANPHIFECIVWKQDIHLGVIWEASGMDLGDQVHQGAPRVIWGV